MEEYKKQFPNALLVAEKYKNCGDKNPIRKKENKEKFLKVVKSKSYRENASKRNKIRYKKLTKEERSKIYGLKGDKNPSKREDVKKKISEGVSKSYINNPELRNLRSRTIGEIGKENFKKIAEKNYRLGIWIKAEDKEGFNGYKEQVRKLTEQNFKKDFKNFKNYKLRGKNWHLDHRVSISYGFKHNIPPEIIGHIKNLEIIEATKNIKKNFRCSISYDKLIEEINSV